MTDDELAKVERALDRRRTGFSQLHIDDPAPKGTKASFLIGNLELAQVLGEAAMFRLLRPGLSPAQIARLLAAGMPTEVPAGPVPRSP